MPLLLAGLLVTACATPDADTAADEELSCTPGGDVIEEPDPDVEESDLYGDDPEDEGPTGDEQRGEDFDGERLTEADLTSRLSSLGTHLVDGHGRTLYVFAADPAGERTCTAELSRNACERVRKVTEGSWKWSRGSGEWSPCQLATGRSDDLGGSPQQPV